MTSYCFRISEDLHRFARNLQHMSAKLFLLLFLNNFRRATCKIVQEQKQFCAQICANLYKSWNNMMSNDGLIIENMNLSLIHLAVPFPHFLLQNVICLAWWQVIKITLERVILTSLMPCSSKFAILGQNMKVFCFVFILSINGSKVQISFALQIGGHLHRKMKIIVHAFNLVTIILYFTYKKPR